MPILRDLYQTVSAVGGIDGILQNGPILCKEKPWFCEGYYFWDGNMVRATWWGKTHYFDNYIVCEAWANIEDSLFLDLGGSNHDDINLFNYLSKPVFEEYGDNLTMPFIFNCLKDMGNFPFEAVRVRVEGDALSDEKIGISNRHSYAFYNSSPDIQICIYNRDLIRDYHVIVNHPNEEVV